MFALEGKVALVTGASQGLGRGLAITLARHGCSVVLAARQRDKLEAVRHEIEAAGGAALVVPCDLGDRDAIKAAAEASETKLGPVSILVNNAGVALSKPVMEQSDEDWDLVLGTNLKGAFLMAQAAARRMIANRVAGSIINIVSVLGLGVVGHLAPYCAAKAGLIHLTKAMAFELARHDIRSNAIAPGYIETDMNRSFFRTEQGQKLIRKIPQRRLARTMILLVRCYFSPPTHRVT
jgi:3-oxoacyl-[acyl-carrier protein] reductase